MIAGLVAGAALLTANANRSHADLPDEGPLPDFGGAIGWPNTAPLNGSTPPGEKRIVSQNATA